MRCNSVCWSDTHSVYLVESLPLFVRDSQVLCGLDAAAQLAGPDLQILQLLLLHKASQGGRKLQQGGNSVQHLKFINLVILLTTCFHGSVWRLFVPVCPAARGLRRRPAAPPGCRCSLRADTGRWFGAGRGCSSGSRRSYSGCDPGSG